MITTLIFDLDGILIDLCDFHRRIFQKACVVGAGLSIENEYHDKWLNGLPTRTKIEKIGIAGRPAVEVARLKQQYTLEELQNIQPDLVLRSILENLHDQYNVFCASNSLRETVKLVLEKLGVIDLFDGYYGNDDVFHAKPSPEMYLKCMVQAPARPRQTLAIEDSEIGRETIKNVGCHGLILKNRKELRLDTILSRIEEVESV